VKRTAKHNESHLIAPKLDVIAMPLIKGGMGVLEAYTIAIEKQAPREERLPRSTAPGSPKPPSGT
jgi:hypothetical protein